MATNPNQWQFDNLDELERLEFVWCVAHMHLMVEPNWSSTEQDQETPGNISTQNTTSDNLSPKDIDNKFQQEEQQTKQTNISAYPQDTETKPSDDFVEDKATDNKANPVSIPDPFPLPHPAEIGKALLPLARRIVGIWKNQIDIEATVEQTAEANGLITVAMKAPLERQYEIHIFVDVSPSMKFWDDLTAGVATLFRWQGFFRDVRVWQIDTSSDKMHLYSDETRIERDIATLITPRKNRLFMVITDTLGKAWRSGDTYQQLAFLGKTHSVTIAHIFPQYLWSRTSLFRASERPLTAAKSNCANSQLQRGGRKLRTEDDISQFPILNLLPEHFATWAKFLTGEQGKFIQGVILKQTDFQINQEKKPEESTENTEAEYLLREFLLDATPPARKLAQILAAVPLIPPVMRLAQKQFLEESEYWHLAEVFFSGLLQRSEFSPEDATVTETWYEFLPGIRELLLASNSVMETTEIWREIGSFVESKYGSPRNFQALIPDSTGSIDDPLSNRDLYFAEVDAAVFITWGGQYAAKGQELLAKVETNKKTIKSSEDGAEDKENDTLEIFEFEAEVATIVFEPEIEQNENKLNTIFLVEDEPEVVEIISEFLSSQYGITVRGTEDVSEIITLAQTSEIDLILINYELPNSHYKDRAVNGLEIVKLLKADPNISSSLPIVGFSFRPVSKLFFESGADGFYSKGELLENNNYQKFVDYLQEILDQVAQTESSQSGKNYAITVGMNHYDNLRSRNYAKHDAETVKRWCETQGNFDRVFLFTDDSQNIAATQRPIPTQPTYRHLRRFLRAQFQRPFLETSDNLWFFFFGYGKQYQDQHYLMLSDSDPDGVEYSALTLNFIVQQLLGSGAGKVILFLDLGGDSQENYFSLSSSLMSESKKTHQGIIVFYSGGAYESDLLKQGSFTYALLEALKATQGNLSMNQLAKFLRDRVRELNEQNARPTQPPQTVIIPTSLGEWIPFPSNFQVFDCTTPTINRKGETIKQDTKLVQYFTETLYEVRNQKSEVRSGFDNGDDNVYLEMVAIPGGTFTMGSPDNESKHDDERPQHNVTVSPFFMGKYPITQAQWRVIASRTDLKVNIDLDEDPSRFEDPYQKDQKTIERWLKPVERVNWYEAVEFCQRLSKLTQRNYQLPSEAQWEYACRAFTEPLNLENGETYPPFYFGETLTEDLANHAASHTYANETPGEDRGETTPVGQFPPNAFGLYDMHGNVREWCADDWHDNYGGAPTDGSAWVDKNEGENVNGENGSESSNIDNNKAKSLTRGGSWGDIPHYCRSAIRFDNDRRDARVIKFGFRVICVFGSE